MWVSIFFKGLFIHFEFHPMSRGETQIEPGRFFVCFAFFLKELGYKDGRVNLGGMESECEQNIYNMVGKNIM